MRSRAVGVVVRVVVGVVVGGAFVVGAGCGDGGSAGVSPPPTEVTARADAAAPTEATAVTAATDATETSSNAVDTTEPPADAQVVEGACASPDTCPSFSCVCGGATLDFQRCGADGHCEGAAACEEACAGLEPEPECVANEDCAAVDCACPDGVSGGFRWCRDDACMGAADCADACASSGHGGGNTTPPVPFLKFGDDCVYGYECDQPPGYTGQCVYPEGAMYGYCTTSCTTSATCPAGWGCELLDGLQLCHP